MNLQQIANATIPAAYNKSVIKYEAGDTRDIIKEVLECYQQSNQQLKDFAPHLKGETLLQTCKNIWNFWKQNIQYQVDTEGYQFIKTPAAVWASKYCDCKSFSVAVASTLSCLGINSKFRFASYGSNTTTPTHVYVIALQGQKEIIVDCVYTAFNSQKTFKKNWDYMTQILRISGLDNTCTNYAVGELNIDENDKQVTHAELSIALQKQRLELEQSIARKRHGVGALDDAYQTEIESHSATLQHLAGLREDGVGAFKMPALKAPKKLTSVKHKAPLSKKQQNAKVVIKKRKAGFLKKLGGKLKNIVKSPLRLAAKTQLGKNAPFFLYLFITDAKVLAKLPTAVKIKLLKATSFKKIVVQKLEMPEASFTTIVRNGIMAKLGDTPENVLAKWMADANYTVGFLPVVLAAAKFGAMGIKALLGKFGAKLAADVEQFTPAPEDWGGGEISPALKQAMANDVQAQSSNGYSVGPADKSGNYPVKDEDTGEWDHTDASKADRATNGSMLNDAKDLDDVTVTADKPASEGMGTMGLLLAGGLAIALLGGKKGKK